MKKSFLLVGAAAIFMASCSNDEVIETPRGQAIGFSSFVNNSTRATDATDITPSTLQDFAVWAVTYTNGELPASIFGGDRVYKNNGSFTYANERYWLRDKNYRFSAIAPYAAKDNGLSVTQSVEEISTTPTGGIVLDFNNATAGANIDLCYAFKTIEGNDNIPSDGYVRFDFKHLLSRAKFTFNNKFPDKNSVIRILDVQITNAPAQATLDKTAGAVLWTRSEATPTTFSINFSPINPPSTDGYIAGVGGLVTSVETQHMYLIPLTEAQNLTMTFKVALYSYDDTLPENQRYRLIDTYTHTNCTLPTVAFENNMSYNFVCDITKDNIDPEGQLNPIKFDVQKVEDWGAFGEKPVDHDHPATPSTPVRRK